MPRKKLIRNSESCYHVTTRSNNKEWFYIPTTDCWKIFEQKLYISAEKYKINIHAFVLMSNHFHLLLSSPNKNINLFMQHLISCVTRTIQFRTKRINHVFGARYKWSLLYSPVALAYAYKYILRNPVRAGICHSVEDYAWSTFNNLNTTIPVSEGFDEYWRLIPKDPKNRLEWLNTGAPRESEALIGKALRRFEFQFSKHANSFKHRVALAESYGIENE